LATAYPDLDAAPKAVADTADMLLGKLENGHSAAEPERREPVPLPARELGARVWAEDGVVADIPGLENELELPVVDVKMASRVRRLYGLKGMSEVVGQRVHAQGHDGRDLLLPHERRLEALVLLAGSSTDRRALAAQLRRLREEPVERIDLEVTVDGAGRHWSRDLPFKLIAEGPRTTLYTTRGVSDSLLELAGVLADYLTVPEQAERLGLILIAPAQMAAKIHNDELAEAEELLRDSETARPQEEPQTEGGPASLEPVGVPTPERPLVDSDVISEQEAVSVAVRNGRPRAGRNLSRAATAAPLGPEQNGSARHTGPPDPAHVSFGEPLAAEFPEGNPNGNALRASARVERGDAPMPFREPRGAPRSDDEIEEKAVAYVCTYARHILGVAEVRDVQQDDLGWDLEFVYANGDVELVEVKGSGGDGPFNLTVNELDQARENDNYVLYFLAEQRTGLPRLYRFDRFGTRVSETEHLRPASWWVDGWRCLEPVLIPISVDAGTPVDT
jgi:hypothetical protein